MSIPATATSPDRKRSAPGKSAGRTKAKTPPSAKSTSPIIKTPPPSAPVTGTRVTKQEQVLALLGRPEGASIEDMMHATAWQQHSVRGFLAGTVKKKLGLALTSSKAAGEARRYRIVSRRGR